LTPIEFAYQHFGRHIAPESPTAWLYQPGLLLQDGPRRAAGTRNAGMGGTIVWIGESCVKVYGPDYRDKGYPASGDSKEGRVFVTNMCLKVPDEPWIAVIFGKPGADPAKLVLNGVGCSTVAYYDTKLGVRWFEPKALARAAAGFDGLSVSEAMDTIRIVEAQRAVRLYSYEVAPHDLVRLEKIRAKCPTAVRAAGTFLRAGTMRAGLLSSYLKEIRRGS
jgi:hypothetical protein